MQRNVWRKVLPGIQALIYALLVSFGCLYRPVFKFWLSPHSPAPGEWVPTWIDGALPWQEQIATGLNVPAAMLSEFLLQPFQPILSGGAQLELASHVLTVIFLPFLWYAVVRSVDNRHLPESQRHSVLARILVWGMLTCLLTFAAMMLSSIVFIRNGYLTVKVFALVWTVLGSVVVWGGLRNRARSTRSQIGEGQAPDEENGSNERHRMRL